MPEARAYAAFSPTGPLAPWTLRRREPGEKDVRIEILYCGICHSDLHSARSEWEPNQYPLVPGHEIVGRVSRVGRKVRRFKVGDTAGVGCMVDSCRRCANCKKGLEQHCSVLASYTYASTEQDGKTPTQGGYSSHIVVDEAFVFKIAAGQPLERVAPLLCAGITTYSPLKRHGVRKGSRVGVWGLGGLGHMAVKIAAAMGAEVTMVSGSASKKTDAKRLGARDFALTTDPATAAKYAGRFDVMIDTISAPHDVNAGLAMLKTEGALVLVGAPPKPLEVAAFSLIRGRRTLAGSLIGGVAETQEMLDFCARRKIFADVEVIAARDVNAAYERMLKGDVRYRFVIDAKTI